MGTRSVVSLRCPDLYRFIPTPSFNKSLYGTNISFLEIETQSFRGNLRILDRWRREGVERLQTGRKVAS